MSKKLSKNQKRSAKLKEKKAKENQKIDRALKPENVHRIKNLSSEPVPRYFRNLVSSLNFKIILTPSELKYCRAYLKVREGIGSFEDEERSLHLIESTSPDVIYSILMKIDESIYSKHLKRHSEWSLISSYLTRPSAFGFETRFIKLEELKTEIGTVYSSPSKPKIKNKKSPYNDFRVAFTNHTLERLHERNIVRETAMYAAMGIVSEKMHRYLDHVEAISACLIREYHDIIKSETGEEMLVIYGQKAESVDIFDSVEPQMNDYIIGYCPISVDFYKQLLICKSFLGVGMKGTPEETLIKKAGLGHLLKNIDFDFIRDEPELNTLLMDRLKVNKAVRYDLMHED